MRLILEDMQMLPTPGGYFIGKELVMKDPPVQYHLKQADLK